MEDCIFCRIVRGEMNADIVYEDDKIMAFEDVNPQAPVHILIVPREHIPRLSENTDERLLGALLKVAAQLAQRRNIAEDGYRIVVNTNRFAGQSVDHLHFHLLGGRKMNWPPG